MLNCTISWAFKTKFYFLLIAHAHHWSLCSLCAPGRQKRPWPRRRQSIILEGRVRTYFEQQQYSVSWSNYITDPQRVRKLSQVLLYCPMLACTKEKINIFDEKLIVKQSSVYETSILVKEPHDNSREKFFRNNKSNTKCVTIFAFLYFNSSLLVCKLSQVFYYFILVVQCSSFIHTHLLLQNTKQQTIIKATIG